MKKLTTLPMLVVLIAVFVVSMIGLGVFLDHASEHSHEYGSATRDHDHNHANHSQHEHGNSFLGNQSETQLYTCSMHPSFRTDDPHERCPICGMELIPVSSSARSDDDGVVKIELSPRSLALINVQTEPARRGSAAHSIHLVGQIDFDERGLTTISAWVPGRIERLHVNYTGAEVAAGDPLVEIYSPELLVAQQELLQAEAQSRSNSPAFLRDSQQATFRAARERLRLLGLSGAQIDDIIQRGTAEERILIRAPSAGTVVTRSVSQGAYVNTGDTLLEMANSKHLWALFEVFERDLAFVNVGEQVSFRVNHIEASLQGTVVSVAPRMDPERRTRTVRVALEDVPSGVTPGSFTRAQVNFEVEDVLTIPLSAALITGTRALVYVRTDAEAGAFEARTIELGRRLGERYEVLGGIAEGDLVVSRGAFRIDSELQLRGSPSMMSPAGGGSVGHAHHGEMERSQTQEHREQVTATVVTGDVNLDVDALFNAYHEMWAALHSDELSAWQDAAQRFHQAGDALDWPSALSEVEAALRDGRGHVHHVDTLATARDQFYRHSLGVIALAEQRLHSGTVYLMYCPMARRGQGAHWLQTEDELLNPYFGAGMLRCGERQAVFPDGGAH